MIFKKPIGLIDARNLFNLKNDKVVRENAINKKKILWREHLNWLELNRMDIIIVYDIDDFVGDVRIKDKEISIRLTNEYRGKGIGTKLIKRFSRVGMIARIIEGNIGSMRIFIKNGFNFIDYKDGIYTLKKWK